MKLGTYELIRKLATGGMAELFLAKARSPGGFEKTLAVKRLLPHLAEDPELVATFLAEARLASRLTHPNIGQLFDLGRDGRSYYLAMEYINGPTLSGLLRAASAQSVPLPPVLCAWMVAQACEGLAYAHDFCDSATRTPWGLVHGDVSLDNILVSHQGTVKVVDFGIARAAGRKLSYRSPEQLRDKPLDRRVDVYALGVVFYELLTGRTLFDAKSELSLAKAILCEQPVPAVQRRTELPKAVQWILDRALAKDREKRYPDCHAFQADLEAFIRATRQAVGASQLSRFIERVIGPAPEVALPTLAPRSALAATRAMAARRARLCPEAITEQSVPTERWASPYAE